MARTRSKQNDAPDKLLKCDGQMLKDMIRAGMAFLELNYQHVNALNVFPVPDGDTGTNMLLTIRSAYKEIAESSDTNVGRIANQTYNGALMGARGNSGVILSQLMLGLAHALDGLERIGADELVRGLRVASQTADNVRGMKPVEGTILTVARDGATAAEMALRQSNDIRFVLAQVVDEMKRSVERTPDLLVKDGEYILKKAGVVDAGGMGLAYIMEGMLRNLNGEVLAPASGAEPAAGPGQDRSINLSGLDYPYDVQFLLIGENLDIAAVTDRIESMGDSALVAGDSKLIKVHIHVTNPGVPLTYASELGKLTDVVVENMALQYESYKSRGGPGGAEAAVIEPPQVAEGTIAVIAVAPGIGLQRIMYSLGAGRVISGGQTMNPSTEEIVEAINSLPTDKVVILPNNKNILLAAQQAAELVPGKQTAVVPSTTIPQGIAALLSHNPHGALAEVSKNMLDACHNIETGEITRATRSVSIDGVEVREGQLIGLHNDNLRVAGDDMGTVTLDLLREMGVDQLELLTFYYGADTSRPDAEALIRLVAEAYPHHEIELQEGLQPHYYYIISAE